MSPDLTRWRSAHRRKGDMKTFRFRGREYSSGSGTFKVNFAGMSRLALADRLYAPANSLQYMRKLTDFSVLPLADRWESVQLGTGLTYVVQTSVKVIERCIQMTTDPGDLVMDPTCGSGTTATVAEQWGRRWITIDTSRVALALARARIMGARYPFYLLADSREGQIKEGEITRTAPSSRPAHQDVRQGFVYERVPRRLNSVQSQTIQRSILFGKNGSGIWSLFAKSSIPLSIRIGKNGRFHGGRTQNGPTAQRICTVSGGRPASAARRQSTPPLPPRPSLNTSTTSPMRTREEGPCRRPVYRRKPQSPSRAERE